MGYNIFANRFEMLLIWHSWIWSFLKIVCVLGVLAVTVFVKSDLTKVFDKRGVFGA